MPAGESQQEVVLPQSKCLSQSGEAYLRLPHRLGKSYTGRIACPIRCILLIHSGWEPEFEFIHVKF